MTEWCPYCDDPMSREAVEEGERVPWNKATRHHVLAQRFGGQDTYENLRWCCLRCNQCLSVVEECPGALAAARAILRAEGMSVTPGNVQAVCRPLWPKWRRR